MKEERAELEEDIKMLEYTADNHNSECEWDELVHKTEANSRVD